MRSTLLIIDAVIDLALGTLLIIFPLRLFQLLGLPVEVPPFYGIILGGVLIGIGIALLMGLSPKVGREGWLGPGGAMIINLFGALALAALLASGRIYISLRGYLILLGLLFLLVVLSIVEWSVLRSNRKRSTRETVE
jgi:hypothetical protein